MKPKLIFVISLPRSGSTLLQHILGNHSCMAASAEPWLLLPHLLALNKNAIKGIYDANIGRIALMDFLEMLEEGQKAYYKGIRKYSDHLYGSFLKKNGKKFYVDKTSRYYLALPELYQVYPDAKYIFLIRNPLSILASFIENMVQGNIQTLGRNESIRTDLMQGYKIIVNNKDTTKVDCTVIQYESLINNPDIEIEKLCEFLGVDYESDMISYKGTQSVFKGTLVDPKSIHKHNAPVKDYLNTWEKVIDNNDKKKFSTDYLNYLGKDIIGKAGYDFTELKNKIDSKKLPGKTRFSFEKIMDGQMKPRKRKFIFSSIYLAIKQGDFKLVIYRMLKPLIRSG